MGPLWRVMPISRDFFNVSLGVRSEQGLLLKIKSHLSLKVPGKEAPPTCSANGAPIKRVPGSRAFVYVSLGDPGGGALQIVTCPLQVPPTEPPVDRDVPLQSLLLYIS
jgi:hypothetical protein